MNLKQIAQELNLSLSTVSLVLNNKPGVRQETRNRVSELLQQNGYTIRDAQTSSETAAPPRTLLFIRYRGSGCLMDSKDDFFIQILDGIESQSRLSGFNVQIRNIDRSNLENELSNASAVAAGVILFATELEDMWLPVLHRCTVPLVVLDSMVGHENINSVCVENTGAMYQAVSYLHSIGHRKIGYLHSVEATGAIPEREAGYYAAMQALGLEVNPTYVHKLFLFADRTHDQMCRILAEHPDLPTAFVSDNDVLAVGAMRAFHECGYRIPDDISIVGFDDSYICTITTPTLTTVCSPKNAIGAMAVRRLKEILDTGDRTIVKAKLCTSIMVRESTMPLETK